MAGLVKLFQSSDPGFSNVANTPGSLISNVLDPCLINGANLTNVTSITRAGSVATAHFSAGHTFVGGVKGNVVLIAGANEVEYNGEFIITNVTANTFDYTITGTPASPATGTLTAKRAPAGWSKLSGTNLAAYRSQGVGATGCYAYFDDTGTTEAVFVGNESMADISTPSGRFPTTVQISSLFVPKSNNATSKPWLLIADDRGFALFVAAHSSYPSVYYPILFQDFASDKAGDGYGCLIVGETSNQWATNYPGVYDGWVSLQGSLTATAVGHYLARKWDQVGGAVPFGKFGDYSISGYMGATSGIPYPSPVNGGLYVSDIAIGETASGGVIRGRMRGIYQPLHGPQHLGHGNTQTDTVGPLAGHTLLAVATPYSGGTPGETLVDLTSWT